MNPRLPHFETVSEQGAGDLFVEKGSHPDFPSALCTFFGPAEDPRCPVITFMRFWGRNRECPAGRRKQNRLAQGCDRHVTLSRVNAFWQSRRMLFRAGIE